MKPTDILVHEHEIILMVLEVAEREARAVAGGGTVNSERISEIIDFVRNFADRCHHGKEEDLLFATLVERGFPREYGPIGIMLQEHALGREHIQAAAASLPRAAADDPAARTALADALLGYVALLRAHIQKENTILFPMADQLLSDEDRASLLEAFDRVEREEMGDGTHERYHRLAHQLTGR
jgi:hemerythrin-like domain-containing protein